jgi:hypothetical protein
MAKPPDPPRRPNPAGRSRRERSERQAVFRQAVLVFLDQQRLQVALKSLSETGARVEYLTRMELPEEVTLIEPTLRLRRRARVVWQREGVAGLQFID